MIIGMVDELELVEERREDFFNFGTGHSQDSPFVIQALQVGFNSSHFLCFRRQFRHPVLTLFLCGAVETDAIVLSMLHLKGGR
jgi:hypothetical protein